MKTVKKTLIICLALTFLFGELAHASEKVICVEQGGHFVLEDAVNGNCGGFEKDSHHHSSTKDHSHPFLSEDDSHCGYCNDYSFKNGNVLTSNPSGSQTSLLFVAKTFSQSVAEMVFPEFIPDSHYQHAVSGPSPAQNNRRTIVLLI